MRLQIMVLVTACVGCSGPPQESTTAQNVISPSPLTNDFGMLAIGQTSTSALITVDPGPGNQSDTIVGVSADCPDFLLDAPGLPADVYRVCEIITCADDNSLPNCDPRVLPLLPHCQTTDSQSYSFTAQFRPTVAGPVTCVVTISAANSSSTRTISLSGYGVPPPINADVQPAAVAFGDVRRDADSTQAQIVVRSTGGDSLIVSTVTISAGFQIVAGPQTGYALPPSEVQSYAVVCHPGAVGPMSGQFVVTSNDPDQPTIEIPLSCNGIDSNLDIAPSPAALATTRVGEPVEASIDLRNTGAAMMTLESVTLTGRGITMLSTPAPGTVLDTAAKAEVMLRFDATTKGEVRGTLVATYDGGQSRSTEITAVALATSMALSPDGDVGFGPVCAGTSKTQDFTLIGNDQGAFSLDTLSDPGPPFTITSPVLPLQVKGAGATQVKFQVTAAPVTAGVTAADVVVHTDIPHATDHTLHLTVEGLAAGITATPATVELGANPVNTTTIGREVHLSNCGATPIAFTNPRIEGTDALDFAIVAQPAMPMIESAGNATWLIVLQAHSVGFKEASFSVDYDGGTATVALEGEGLGDAPVVVVAERGSYYACATGRPSALWPIALALLVLRRRRARRA